MGVRRYTRKSAPATARKHGGTRAKGTQARAARPRWPQRVAKQPPRAARARAGERWAPGRRPGRITVRLREIRARKRPRVQVQATMHDCAHSPRVVATLYSLFGRIVLVRSLRCGACGARERVFFFFFSFFFFFFFFSFFIFLFFFFFPHHVFFVSPLPLRRAPLPVGSGCVSVTVTAVPVTESGRRVAASGLRLRHCRGTTGLRDRHCLRRQCQFLAPFRLTPGHVAHSRLAEPSASLLAVSSLTLGKQWWLPVAGARARRRRRPRLWHSSPRGQRSSPQQM